MSPDPARAERGASRFRYFLPHSLVARRMVLLSLGLWVAFRMMAGAVISAVAEDAPPPEDATKLGVQAVVWVAVTAAVVGAVMIDARRRGDALLLANLGSPPAAVAGWIAALVTLVDWGAWWLLR